MHSPNRPNGRHAQRCGSCGKEFARNLTGRRKKFCNDNCRDQARRHRKAVQRLKNGAHYPYSVEPRNDAKSACGPRGKLPENGGRPPDIHAPRHVIEAEINSGHVWAETISTDGVRCLVAQIRPAALIEKRTRPGPFDIEAVRRKQEQRRLNWQKRAAAARKEKHFREQRGAP